MTSRDLKAAEKEYCNAGDTLRFLKSDRYEDLYTCQNKKGEITLNKCGKDQVIGVWKGGDGCTYLSYYK